MTTNQGKILNYLLFFLLSLTGLASLFLVKNNYLYIFILVFLLLYWQRGKVTTILANYLKFPPSYLTFLTLGMVGVLFFQLFSGSPRFYQRPILTLIVSLLFYLPYFFLWHKIFLKRKISLLGAFFLSGLGGVLILGILSGKLTNTIFIAPTLVSGLFFALLKAAGILSVVGTLTAFPFLFFSKEKTSQLAGKVEKKNNAGFGLIEVLVGLSIFSLSLSLVGVARHRQKVAEQRLATIKQSRLEKLTNLRQKQAKQGNETLPLIKEATPTPTNIPKTPEDELQKPRDSGVKQPRPQTGSKTKKTKEGRTSKEGQTQEGSTQAPSTKDELKQPKAQVSKDKNKRVVPLPQGSGGFPGQEIADPATCQAIPSLAGCEIYYDPYSDPTSPEYQVQLQEEWYANQQDPSQLFFNDPVQLWSQDPFLYDTFQGIYGFDPIPGFP